MPHRRGLRLPYLTVTEITFVSLLKLLPMTMLVFPFFFAFTARVIRFSLRPLHLQEMHFFPLIRKRTFPFFFRYVTLIFPVFPLESFRFVLETESTDFTVIRQRSTVPSAAAAVIHAVPAFFAFTFPFADTCATA